MRVDLVERRDDRVTARLVGVRTDATVDFRMSGASSGAVADALVPLSLLPAMREGGSLLLPGAVSPRLIGAVPAIEELLLTWDRFAWAEDLAPVKVEATLELAEPGPVDGVACFFSGGVDSTYTVLKHRETISHLIFVHGLDVGLRNRALRERVTEGVHAFARALGKDVIEVETDVRQASDPIVDWLHYHGSVLAAIGHLTAGNAGTVLVPASDTFATLSPFGTHPLLDPLWSSERVSFVHDGCEASRVDKLGFLARQEHGLTWLRVCPKEPSSGLNCGQCHKCLRTMVALRVEAVLDRSPTFPADLDLGAFARLGPPSPQSRMLWQAYARRVRERGDDPELARAIRSLLSRWRSHLALERSRISHIVQIARGATRRAGR